RSTSYDGGTSPEEVRYRRRASRPGLPTRAGSFPPEMQRMGDYGVVTTRRPPTPRNRTRTGASQRGSTSQRAGTARASAAPTHWRASTTRPRTRRGPASRPHSGPQAARAGRSTASAPRRAEEQQPAQPRQITVRGLVLFVVVLMAFIVLAPTLRAYVNQQEEHRELAAQISDTKDHNEQLRQEIERWDSEAYIKAEARERLGLDRKSV